MFFFFFNPLPFLPSWVLTVVARNADPWALMEEINRDTTTSFSAGMKSLTAEVARDQPRLDASHWSDQSDDKLM